MRVVVTGAAGFIGSNLVTMMVTEYGYDVVAVDALTYAGNLSNLRDVMDRITFVHADVCDADAMRRALAGARAVVHLAAESHVDRSLRDARRFVETNVLGTQTLLDVAREAGVDRFVQVSTDEVYGSLGEEGVFREGDPVRPRSPYAASKAAADLLALACHHTHGLPVIVTRCTNNYGPRQHPEKLIPKAIVRALSGREIPVYGDGRNVRDWIHVEDHCRGIVAALERGEPGSVYHFGANQEMANIDLVRMIVRLLGVSESCIRFVADRPGHDFRYALDTSGTRERLGWRPRRTIEEGLRQTVEWYRAHVDWWKPLVEAE